MGERSRRTPRFLLEPLKGWSYHQIRFEREHHEFGFGYVEFDVLTLLSRGVE